MYAGQIGQVAFERDMPKAVPGMIRGMGNYRGIPYTNTVGGTQGVYTITPPATPDASATYKLTVDGSNTVSVTTDDSPTAPELGTLLYNAMRTDPQIYRKMDLALNSSTGVITATSLFFGVAIAFTSNSTETTNDLTIATTTAPATGSGIPFGRFVGKKSTYSIDPNTGFGQASLINAASGFEVVGMTLKVFLEKERHGQDADSLYPFKYVMSVMEDCGTIQGVCVEVVEPDITMNDPLYVAVGAGNEGKATKTASGNVDISTKGKFITNAFQSLGKNLAYVFFRRY